MKLCIMHLNIQGILFYIQFSVALSAMIILTLVCTPGMLKWNDTDEESIDLNAMDHYIAIEMMGLECEQNIITGKLCYC